MRKNILVYFLLLFFNVSFLFSQTEERPANGPKGVKNVRDQLRRRQGDWSSYNNEGDLLRREAYVNDKKEGLSSYYYPGGGPESDKVKEETYYFGGKKDSISVKKYLSGQVSVEGSYDMGKKDGKWTTYYEDGQIKTEGAYKAGKREGEWKFFNRKGKLVKSATYANGVDSSIPKPAAKGGKDAKGAAGKDAKGGKDTKGGTGKTPTTPPAKK